MSASKLIAIIRQLLSVFGQPISHLHILTLDTVKERCSRRVKRGDLAPQPISPGDLVGVHLCECTEVASECILESDLVSESGESL